MGGDRVIRPAAPHMARVDPDAESADRTETLRRCADILYGTGDPESATLLLERYPGCLLVSLRDARGRCVTVSRGGMRSTISPVLNEHEHALIVSMLHQWLIEISSPPTPAAGRRAARRPSD
jgi:hypothetical protein